MAILSFFKQKAKEAPKQIAQATVETGTKVIQDASSQITGQEPYKPTASEMEEKRRQQQQMVGGVEAVKSESELKSLRLREKMRKGMYKNLIAELDRMTPDDRKRKREQEIAEHYQELGSTRRSTVEQIGKPQTNSETKRKQEEKEADDQKAAEAKAEQQRSLDEPVEAPVGKKTGFPGRRKSPTRMRPPKSSERKQGIGG